MPSRLITDLCDQTHAKAIEFLAAAEIVGVKLKVTDTLRTFDEQATLYALGRTKPGRIVTRAKPGEGMHNVRRAFDVAVLRPSDNALDFAWMDSEECAPFWHELGLLGAKHRLTWGGSWTTFKDRPHFEDPWCVNCEIDVTRLAGPTAIHFDALGNCRESERP